MSNRTLPVALCSRENAQIEKMWNLLRDAFVSKKPDVSLEDLVHKTAGRPVAYRYASYVGARASHINKILTQKGLPFRVKPGTARGPYAIIREDASL